MQTDLEAAHPPIMQSSNARRCLKSSTHCALSGHQVVVVKTNGCNVAERQPNWQRVTHLESSNNIQLAFEKKGTLQSFDHH